LIDEEDIQAVVETLRSGWVTTGPSVKAFERAFSGYVDVPQAVAVNSCTAAMHLALAALGIGPGDRVVTSTYTFVATAEAILYLGAEPIFIDIQEDDFNLDVGMLETTLKRLNSQVKAVMPVHVAGHPCDMVAITELARKYDFYVVEDAAHALESAVCVSDVKSVGRKALSVKRGEEIGNPKSEIGNPKLGNGRWWKVGSIGDATCFSFYATKNITTGEGGMVTTKNVELAERIRCLSLHGMSRDAWKRYTAEGSWYYEIIEQGYKYNMPDILAALGLAQLKKVERMYALRLRYAKIYEQQLSEFEALVTPKVHRDVRHAWHLYVIRLRSEYLRITRNEFIEKLKAVGIGTSVHFIPLHLQPFYQRKFGHKYGDFPVAEKVYESAISLPLYPKMTEEQVYFVASKVRELVEENYKPVLFSGYEAEEGYRV
jgi:perosamine synthetase